MKKNKVIGLLLLALAIYTVIGMVMDSNSFWSVHNYVTITFSLLAGVVLLKQK